MIKWGLEEATRLGLPAYLEASESGHELYRKFGFKDIDAFQVDFSKWGIDDVHTTWSMLWELPSS